MRRVFPWSFCKRTSLMFDMHSFENSSWWNKVKVWSSLKFESIAFIYYWDRSDARYTSNRVMLSKKETALIIDTKHGSLLRSRHLRQSKNHGDRPLEPCYSLVNQWWWPWSQGCTTRRSEDHKIKIIDIFGSIRKKSLLSSIFCSTSEENCSIFLDIQKLHEVPIPTNQQPSQSVIPTSGYDQNIEGCVLWKFLDSTQRQKWNGHNSLVWTPFKVNDHSLEM